MDFYDLHSSVNRLLVVEYTRAVLERPHLCRENMRGREEWAYRRYMPQMENMEKLNDNTIPYLSMITGTEISAEAFGCRVHRLADNNPFALPLVKEVSDWHKIKVPKLEDTNLVKLFESADRLRDRVGKDALLRHPDACGCSGDYLGKEQFLYGHV